MARACLWISLAAALGCGGAATRAQPASAPAPRAQPASAPAAGDQVPFGPDERERELVFLRDALRDSYAHLEVKRADFGVDLDALFTRALPEIRAADTWARYELVMVELVSALHDGHVAWRRSRGKTEEPLRIVRLGIDTRFAGDELIVSDVWPGSAAERAGLGVGDRILAIDGAPAAKRLERYTTVRSWSRLEAARHDFAAEWPAARQGLGDAPRPRRLERETLAGARSTLVVAPETEPRAGGPPAPWAVARAGDALVVTLRSLDLKGDELDALLRALGGADGVVVDLRGNRGGYDKAAAAIAGRLVGGPTSGGTRRVRLSAAVRAARPAWGSLTPDAARPGWSTPLVLATPPGPAGARRVAALIDAGCHSSCEELALLLRAGGARLVGATTGGSSGGPITITLPSSGARVTVPVWALFDASGRPIEDHGVDPDEPLEATRADIAARRDPVLERAQAIAGSLARSTP
jgi:hypothetical protein